MRLSTIVVCMLPVFPPAALACIEHDPEQTKWTQEVPSSSREAAWAGLDAMGWNGSRRSRVDRHRFGVRRVLVLASFRAFCRAARSEGSGIGESRTEGQEGGPEVRGTGLPLFLTANP